MNKLITNNNLKQTSELILNKNKADLNSYKNDINNIVTEQDKILNELELRTHIGKELDYGYFTTGTISPIGGTEYKLQMLKGNMEVNEAGHVILKAYRKYSIIFENFKSTSSGNTTTNQIKFQLKDDKGNTLIINDNVIANDYSEWGRSSVRPLIIEPEEDIELILYCAYNYNNIVTYASANIMIEEINRQVILDPAEDAKNLEFEYGYFENNENYQFKDGIDFPFKVQKSNLELSDNGFPILKKNKSYTITMSLQLYSSGRYSCRFYDNLTSSLLSENYIDIQSSGATASQSIILKPESDIEFCLNGFARESGYLRYSSLIIQEISHPYYFNYYKDSLSSKVLFEGEASTIGEYELLDDITNYEWLDVYSCALYDGSYKGYTSYLKIKVADIIFRNDDSTSTQSFTIPVNYTSNVKNIFIVFYFTDKRHFYIRLNTNNNGANKGIYRIDGVGFNYENPYKDLISDGDIDNTIETTEEEMNNLTSFK